MSQNIATRTFTACMLVAVALAIGSVPASAKIPSTPDGTVRAVTDGLSQRQPQVLWKALPPSYQQDVTELTREFAKKMDGEVYDKVFAVLRKAVNVLQTKKEYILGSSLMQKAETDPAQVEESYDAAAELLGTVMHSEISSLDSLAKLDFEAFLGGTCAKAMEQAAAISKASPDDPYASQFSAKLERSKVELVASEGDSAQVKVSTPGEEDEVLELTRVEGRWVPSDMAEEWDEKIAEARQKLNEMTQEEQKAQNKMQAMMFLGMADAFVDQLAAVQSSAEFDAAVQGLFGSFMGSGQPGMSPEAEQAPSER